MESSTQGIAGEVTFEDIDMGGIQRLITPYRTLCYMFWGSGHLRDYSSIFSDSLYVTVTNLFISRTRHPFRYALRPNHYAQYSISASSFAL